MQMQQEARVRIQKRHVNKLKQQLSGLVHAQGKDHPTATALSMEYLPLGLVGCVEDALLAHASAESTESTFFFFFTVCVYPLSMISLDDTIV
jgi:hypothetical protein